MAGKHSIQISVLADTAKFRRSMRELGDVSGLTKLSNGVKNLGHHLVTGAKYAAALGGSLAVAGVKAAADLEQSVGTINDIFKNHAGEVHAFAKSAATDVGLSRNAYNELAAVISTQLKNGGTAFDELASKSNELIRLGADLSAGFGGSTTEAVQALSSALKGERDPIEKYGVSLTQAAINAKAAELGFTAVGGALTAEGQQAATLALIMEQTADMHGKFSRESGTLQHNLEVMKAKLTNAAAVLGQYFLPYVTAAVSWLSDRLEPALAALSAFIDTRVKPALATLAQWFNEVLPVIKSTASTVASRLAPLLTSLGAFITGTVVPALSQFASFLYNNRETLLSLTAVIGSAVAGFRAFQTATAGIAAAKAGLTALKSAMTALTANPIGLVVAGIAALVAALVIAYQRSETFRNVINSVWNGIKNAVSAVVTWFQSNVAPVISAVFSIVVSAAQLFASLFTAAWNIAKTAVSTVISAIMTVTAPLRGFLSGLFTAIRSIISAVWGGAWTIAKTAVSTAWNLIRGYVTALSATIRTVVSTVRALLSGNFSQAWTIAKTAVSNAWNGIKTAISSGISNAVSLVKTLPQKILSALGNLGSLLVNAGKSVIGGFVDGVSSMFSKVKNKLSELTSWLPDWKGPAQTDATILKKSGQLVIGGFIDGLESSYGKVRSSLGTLTSDLSGMVTPGGTLTLDTTGAQHSGTVYNVTVQALAPSADIGRAVVAAIKTYEAAGGRRA